MKTKTAALCQKNARFMTLFCALWIGVGSRAVEAQTVTFADANLQLAVERALGLTSGPVTKAQMLQLTNLPAANDDIQSTAGLETASNLTSLFLNGNPIGNYSGITQPDAVDQPGYW